MNTPSSQPSTDLAARTVIAGVQVTSHRTDDARFTPLFRPPALPTPQQIHSDLPFTAHLGPRLRARP